MIVYIVLKKGFFFFVKKQKPPEVKNERQDNTGMYRMQTEKLHYPEKQKDNSR